MSQFGANFFFLPMILINVNEQWFTTMPIYLVLQIYPIYKPYMEVSQNEDRAS